MRPWKLNRVRHVVNSGGVIAYPTEAVYGLGCDPLLQSAVTRILQMKRRSVSKGLILVAADVSQILEYVEFKDAAMVERVMATWPGPVTWLLPASPATPPWIRGQHNNVAVRVSGHPLVQALCNATGVLVSTSANPANCPPARTARKVIYYFGRSLDYVVQGAPYPTARQPSEIRDARTGKIIRGGG